MPDFFFIDQDTGQAYVFDAQPDPSSIRSSLLPSTQAEAEAAMSAIAAQQHVPVPQEVSRAQAQAFLAGLPSQGNRTAFDDIDDYMETLPKKDLARIAWSASQVFRRDSPTVAAMAAMMGWIAADLDTFFIEADKIVL